VSGTGTTETIAVTVHGTGGAVDLAVPLGAGVADVAREYAAQCGLPQVPTLLTSVGRQLAPETSLAAARVESGDVLVAAFGAPGAAAPDTTPSAAAMTDDSSRGAAAWFAVSAVVAVLAGVLAAGADRASWLATVVVLGSAALVGMLPVGRFRRQRAAVAPAFAGAAAFALAWEAGDSRFPLAVAVAALAAAVGAAVARILADHRTETPDVWIVSALTVFGVVGGGVLLDAPPQVAWSVLLVLALLASRFVPAFAIDVPDQLLIDLERLAVNAWSARDRTTGKRGRVVVPEAGINELLTRAAYVVNAAAVATLAVVLVAAPALLWTATAPVDRPGAMALLLFAGGGFLLAARSHRHPPARILLRLTGLVAWVAPTVSLLVTASDGTLTYVALGSPVLAAGVLVAAVATGRGWRSVWWARRAEIAETLCGMFAVGALVVSSGLFRLLWE
jgi:uncharacterized membrane protein HdeD (DUF308 family)